MNTRRVLPAWVRRGTRAWPGPGPLILASLVFSLTLIYFTGFDVVNPIPVSWPALRVTRENGQTSFGQLLGKYPAILTPDRLWRLLGIDERYRAAHAGRGTTIALVEKPSRLDRAGIAAFDRRFGLPPPVILTRDSPATGDVDVEETLDIEWVHAIAPQARIAVVTLPGDWSGDVLAALPWLQVAREIAALHPTVVSTSIILNGWEAMAALREFSLLGRDGLSSAPFFAAAGDSGPAATFPGMLPDVVSVGGVSLAPAARGGLTAWSGTAGGCDWLSFPRPAYQGGPSAWRTTPDVDFVAGFPGYAINVGGVWSAGMGASFATPVLAALWATEMPGGLTAGQAVRLLYRNRGVPGAFIGPGTGSAGLGVPDFRRLAGAAGPGRPPRRYPVAAGFFLAMVLSVLALVAVSLAAARIVLLLNALVLLAAFLAAGPFGALFTSVDPLSPVMHYRAVAVGLSGLYALVFTGAVLLFSCSGLPERLQTRLRRRP